MYIGQFTTIPIKYNGELGQFGHDLFLNENDIKRSGDPTGYVKKQIAETWAGLVLNHDIPKDVWDFETSREAQKYFNLPVRISYRVQL